jgi:hypothetical protein
METELPLSDDIINDNGDLFGTIDEEINISSDAPLPVYYHGCSIEDHRTIFQERHHTNSQWRNAEPPSYYNVSATIDGARQMIWEQAKNEINHVRNRVKSVLGPREPSLCNLLDLVFGPESRMGRLFNEKLYIEHEDFLKQLGTFSLAAAYNLSKTQIFSKNSFVNAQGLADEATYQSFWNRVGVSGCKEPSSPSHVRGLRPLWMDVQSALNETCRELFVKGFDSYMRVTEDDDKMHFEIKNDSDTQGLKITQHVRDNRKGFVAHTTCYTASGLPIGIEWERRNDTTATATKRIIAGQLSPMSGENEPPMLMNTEFAMDRGYITPSLLYDFLIPTGADVLGTVKRSPMFPFTFDQKLSQSDTRQLIDPAGFKTLFMKKLTIGGKDLTGLAYRDGKGGVTLGLTTCEHTRHWDFVLVNPLDEKRQADGEKIPYYQKVHSSEVIDGEAVQDYTYLFDALPVTPLTVKQNTPEWFLMRIFSCTSSASDKLLAEVKQMMLHPESCTLTDFEACAFMSTLNLIHGIGWDRDKIAPSPPTPVQNISTQSPVVPAADGTVLNLNVDNNTEENLELNVKLLISGESLNNGLEERIRNELLSNTMAAQALKTYLEKIGIKSVKDQKKNAEKLLKWLDVPPARRPFINLTKAKLIEACISKFGGKRSFFEASSNEDLIGRLANYQTDPSYIAQSARNTIPQGASVNINLLMKIINSSFLPKLSAKGKEYSKAGHNLEVPFARRLLKHSRLGITKIKVDEIYRVGLVSKEGEAYAKASCDFIAVATVENEKVLVGVECKARVTPGTHQRERRHAEFLSRFQEGVSLSSPSSAGTSNSELYTVIDAAVATNFHDYVDAPHEAVQVLHQAYVCSFSYVLLLVGDSSGNIIRGMY